MIPNKEAHTIIGKWCLIDGPREVEHDFTFLTESVKIPIMSGEVRLTTWLAYLVQCHEEIKITLLENP